MRKLVWLVVLVVLALTATVAFAQEDLSSVDPSGQTVVYWHQFSGAQATTIDALIARFNETNEFGITVTGIPQGNYNDIRELMNAGIVSGELPNLVAGFANDGGSYARDGAAVDLTPYLNDPTYGMTEEELAAFNTALLDFNTINGQLVAWPHQMSAQVMMVNQTLLNELGFDAPPATLDEFRAVACAAAESTGPNGEDRQGFPITTDASMFESFVAVQGGRIYDGEAFTFADNPVVIDTFQLYQDLYNAGCAYIPAERFAEQADFSLGLNPFIVTSTAGFTFVLSAFASSGLEAELVVAPFPRTTEQPVVQVFVPSIIMVPGTPEAQLASWLFLKFLVTPESAATWSEGTGYFNPVTTVTFNEAAFVPGLFPYFAAANALVNSPDTVLYNSPNITAYGRVRGLISEAIANVTSNGMSVADAVATLQAGADQALADSM
ncbi:MAG: extracellular solute-binding protein [Candidatus Flexifilum sp.]